MRLARTDIDGVFILDQERREDERGFFARTWCAEELGRHGLVSTLSQCSISYNAKKGTLRGMHYQAAPNEEEKVVAVARGAIYDVALDLRPGSPSFRKWVGFELSAENGRMLYIPAGCAHGFQTLGDDTLVDYKISVPYASAQARGVRWNDPAFGIAWPSGERVLSERDSTYPNFES